MRRPPSSRLQLGCIADDITGATDLGLILSKGGLEVVQTIGLPTEPISDDVDAVVIALKSRTAPVADAVAWSLAAAECLLEAQVPRLYFKYCSTFDSTDQGNIGPVIDALAERLDVPIVVATPAFPRTGRSVYQGHLFVGDALLCDSSMRNHPLTPMHDPNLVRVLQRQSRRRVGLIRYQEVVAGPDAIRAALNRCEAEGCGAVIVDALEDAHLGMIAVASAHLRLLTGGSGLALGLPPLIRRARGDIDSTAQARSWPQIRGRSVILAGSCSEATHEQLAVAVADGLPFSSVSPEMIIGGGQRAEEVASWVLAQSPDRPAIVAATAEPEVVHRAQATYGRERASEAVEAFMAGLAACLIEHGVRRLIVAGGETSGAVTTQLGVRDLTIGPEIAPGVPWTFTRTASPMALALKSGNFGGPRFFLDAWKLLP